MLYANRATAFEDFQSLFPEMLKINDRDEKCLYLRENVDTFNTV